MAAATSGLPSASGDTVVSRNPAPLFYVCGRFLFQKKPVVIPSFMAAITSIWGLKEKISIVEEDDGVFVFLFKSMDEKQRVLGGGPWFYGGSMLVLADYDGLRPLEEVDLHHLEVWVAVKGLRTGMRDTLTLSRFGEELGEVVEVDPAAVKRRDVIQRIRVRIDVRQRILPRRRFEFSPEFPVMLETRYEKCHGICSDCGFFGHGSGVCDQALMAFVPSVAVPVGKAAVAAPEILVADGGTVPNFSAGKCGLTGESSQLRAGSVVGPGKNSNLTGSVAGLTDGNFGHQVNGLDSEVDGLHRLDVGSGPLGSAGLKSICDDSLDLDEPLLKLKKRGRALGSKNKGPSKKKKKPGSSRVSFPVVKAAEIICPDDKGKSAT